MELAYAQITSNASLTTSTADISGMTVTFTAGSAPVMVKAYVPSIFSATQFASINVLLTNSSNTQVAQGGATCSSVIVIGNYFSGSFEVVARLSLVQGVSYTYKCRAVGTHNSTLTASSIAPAWIQAVEV